MATYARRSVAVRSVEFASSILGNILSPLVLGFLVIANAAGGSLQAEVNITTAHNNIGRTGQNLYETTLTPANVNATRFGKLFSQPINGNVYAQPLYVSHVTIPGKGIHNVVYVATAADIVYAFDADSNGGTNATPLWSVSLVKIAAPAGGFTSYFGVVGTPTIDLTTNTMYLVSSEKWTSGYVFRMHALDITSGAEKFGGPVYIKGAVSGTGSGSSGGVLTFDPHIHYQRPGLLLIHGVVYVSFGSVSDNGPWHGWIFSYSAATLSNIDLLCVSANGSGAGFWMSGSGLTAEVNNGNKPYGRMFVVTGNGSFSASTPYTKTMNYGMSVLNLDLTGGKMTITDEFTPYDWQLLNSNDGDLGSGGIVILPNQTLSSGATVSPMVQVGKSGMIYIMDRNNLGGFHSGGDRVFQEVQTPQTAKGNWGSGIWGSPTYWNERIYLGSTQAGIPNPISVYSYVNGVLSKTPTSQTDETFSYPGPTPSISAQGTSNAILWALRTEAYSVKGAEELLAYDATNLDDLLYSSNTKLSRDNPGGAVKYVVPTVVNGKVYVGSSTQLSVYGLLANAPTVAAPVFNPPSSTFANSLKVSISDATGGAKIYYTTDGSIPTVASNLYTGPITVTASTTITAIASATGYLLGSPVSATYSSSSNAASPVFSLVGGTYAGLKTVTLTDSTSGASIYYTVDGSMPTTSSNLYTKPFVIPVSETVRAFATAPGLHGSTVVNASYTINPLYALNFSQGFAQAKGPIQFNGSTGLDDFRLQLTDGGVNEAGSAFYTTPVNVRAFTTDFTFQLSNPRGDGVTFTIQNQGPGALGGRGGSLGYKGISQSVAIKFDILNGAGEGPNSTGIFTNGALPTVPAIDLTSSKVDLHSGDYMNAHITYNGATLTLTLTDAVTLATFSHAFAIDIPGKVGGPTAYVGFTGGTGGGTASQKVTSWTYQEGPPVVPNYPVGFDGAQLQRNSVSTLAGTALQMATGGVNQASSAYFLTPVGINSFTTDFDFELLNAKADGFTFVLQNNNLTALGGRGGQLGYGGIPNSVAIKFDIFDSSGEGSDSTGVYINGAIPTVPAIDLTASKVKLNSGDVIHAHITYDGTTLTWKLMDTTLPSTPSATNSVTINLPHIFNSNIAYAGFTAGTGGGTAIQNILRWTYTTP